MTEPPPRVNFSATANQVCFHWAFIWELCKIFVWILFKVWDYCLEKIYLLKVINRNTREMCEICSKLTMKAQQDDVIVSLLSTLNIFISFSSVSIIFFEQVDVCWVIRTFLKLDFEQETFNIRLPICKLLAQC